MLWRKINIIAFVAIFVHRLVQQRGAFMRMVVTNYCIYTTAQIKEF